MATETTWFGGADSRAANDLFLTELEAVRDAVEARIASLLDESGSDADMLARAMRAAALGSGKRMRPLLLVLVARDLGCNRPALIDVACAVEMVHAASLILDDLPCMDDASLRRGKPAVHVQFGEDVAILAAVALLSRAFGILATAPDLPPAVRTRLVATLSHTVGAQGLVRGQYLDLHGSSSSPEAIAATNDLKTGVLLGVTVDIAAILAESDDGVAHSLRAFALAAGQAFQLRDDFLDGPGNDSAITGKDTGLDIGKATIIATLGADEAQRRIGACLLDAERHLAAAVGPRQRTRRFLRSMFNAGVPAGAPVQLRAADALAFDGVMPAGAPAGVRIN
jgi:geranylgeranyl diphosphate synthase type II